MNFLANGNRNTTQYDSLTSHAPLIDGEFVICSPTQGRHVLVHLYTVTNIQLLCKSQVPSAFAHLFRCCAATEAGNVCKPIHQFKQLLATLCWAA